VPCQGNINIRRFEVKDRDAVRKIMHDTALMGDPASLFFEGEKIFTDALTLYFTDYEPQSSFVAEVDGRVVGCLIGAKNKPASEKIINEKITPGLLWDALKSGLFLKRKNLIFAFNSIVSILKGEFRAPDFSKDYPATLHINVLKECRGLDLGSRLISAYLEYLKTEGIRGICLATMSDAAGKFFAKQGFELLHSGKRSYFQHILHKDVPLYIYGKKL